MKTIFTAAILVAAAIISGCASTKSPVIASAEARERYKAELDKYQKASFHQKRTTTYLKPTLDSLALKISAILNEPRIKPNVLARTISFYVFPSGRFITGDFTDFPQPDPKLVADTARYFTYYQPYYLLKTAIDSVTCLERTDSIPDYKPLLWLKGSIKNDSSGFIFTFKDTSCYVSNITGRRSRASIMRVVVKGLPDLRHAYNRELRTHPGLAGKITVKFAISESGDVIYSGIIPPQTTIDNTELQKAFTSIIKSFKFAKIDKPGDITEVEYPFNLSP